MKKKTISMRRWNGLAVVLTLSLFAGILTGCGGSKDETKAATTAAAKTETTAAAKAETTAAAKKEDAKEKTVSILGAWDNDEDEMSLYFDDDGIVIVSDTEMEVAAEYEWDGETLEIEDPENGDIITGFLEEDGGDYLLDLGDDFKGYFYQVDEVYYVPGEDVSDDDVSDDDVSDDEDGETTEIAGTAWYLNGVEFHFYEDGILVRDDDPENPGTYSWDGEEGEIFVNGSTAAIMMEDGALYGVEAGETFELEYVGAADESLLDGAYDDDSVNYDDSDSGDFGDASVLIGDWFNESTGDGITFEDDGYVRYVIGDDNGVAEFEFDGENVSFDGFTGHIDSFGDLVIDDVFSWFVMDDE